MSDIDNAIAFILQGDPTVNGWQMPIASFGYSFTTSKLYLKTGGNPTDWSEVVGGGSGSSTASWPVTTTRVYAISNATGDDTRKTPYADPATSSAADYQVACAAAGAAAVKTFAALGALFPRQGNGHTAEIVIQGDASAYAGDITTLIQGATGYTSICIRGTGTNATAGCTAFDGSLADCLYLGAKTAPTMNASGYLVTGTPTTTVIQLLKADSSAPGFTAETGTTFPSAPLGYRFRFDANTTTVALRNVCGYVAKINGTDTVVLPAALGTLPVVGDLLYVEQAGVTFSGTGAFNGADGGSLRFAGLQSATNWTMSFSHVLGFAMCQTGTTLTFTDCPTLTLQAAYSHPVRGSLTVGGSRAGSNLTTTRSNPIANAIAAASSSSITACPSSTLLAGVNLNGLTYSSCQNPQSLGSTGAIGSLVPRIWGAGVTVLDSFVRTGQFEINAATGITARGQCTIDFGTAGANSSMSFPYDGATKGFFFLDTLFTGVGTGLNVGRFSTFVYDAAHLPPEAALGTIKADNIVFRSWASLGGVGYLDYRGNRYTSTNSYAASTMKFSGILFGAAGATTCYLADSGNALAANNTTQWSYVAARNYYVETMTIKPIVNTMANAATATVMKNNVATGLTISIPAGSTTIATVATSVDFIYGVDVLDVLLQGAAGEGGHQLTCSITLGAS